MAETELESIDDNLKKAREQLRSAFIFDVFCRWQLSGHEEPQEKLLPTERQLGKEGMDFFEVQKKLHDKKLYSAECENWWQFSNSVYSSLEKVKKLINIVDLEWGKKELYYRSAKIEEAAKIVQITPAMEKLVKTVEKHDEVMSKKEESQKSIDELKKELDDLREKNRQWIEANEMVREYTG